MLTGRIRVRRAAAPERFHRRTDRASERRRAAAGQVADHYGEVIAQLHTKPAVIGHSFGGLLTQIVAGRGLSAASVSIDSAPFRGVLPLPADHRRGA